MTTNTAQNNDTKSTSQEWTWGEEIEDISEGEAIAAENVEEEIW